MGQRSLVELAERLNLALSAEQLRRAFLHSSYVNERAEPEESNERLEFLGDAVIELAVSAYLFQRYPQDQEGRLTQIKSVVVSGPVLAERARALGLQHYLYLGHGEEESGGRGRSSTLGDAFEALVGVIFSQLGYRVAVRFVRQQLSGLIAQVAQGDYRRDYKTQLQEEAQRQGLKPVYTLVKERGADHRKQFVVRVQVGEHQALGEGHRVKEAEQAAAKQVYQELS